MYSPNPIQQLTESLFHAQYEGASDIVYYSVDHDAVRAAKTVKERDEFLYNPSIQKIRRPRWDSFHVYAMFCQTWGSTAIGLGGMGSAAMTDAYTVILRSYETNEFLVYFGGRLAYSIPIRELDIDEFNNDVNSMFMKSVHEFKTKNLYRKKDVDNVI